MSHSPNPDSPAAAQPVHTNTEARDADASPTPPPDARSVEQRFRDGHRRARQHWFGDGLAELVVGGSLLAVAAYLAVDAGLDTADIESRAVRILLKLLFPAIVLAAGVVGPRLIRRTKERFVYPRTGYVSYTPSRVPRWLPAILGGAVAALAAVLLRRAPSFEAWIPALQGVIVGGALVMLGRSAQLPRLVLSGLAAMLCGIVVSLVAVPTTVATAIFYAVVGSALVLTGWLTLRRFVRDAPPPEAQ